MSMTRAAFEDRLKSRELCAARAPLETIELSAPLSTSTAICSAAAIPFQELHAVTVIGYTWEALPDDLLQPIRTAAIRRSQHLNCAAQPQLLTTSELRDRHQAFFGTTRPNGRCRVDIERRNVYVPEAARSSTSRARSRPRRRTGGRINPYAD